MNTEFNIYTPHNNTDKYIYYYNKSKSAHHQNFLSNKNTLDIYNKWNSNKIQIDIKFYTEIYKPIMNPYLHLKHYGIENGAIFHPNQLDLILKKKHQYILINDKIHVNEQGTQIPIQKYVKENIDTLDSHSMLNDIIAINKIISTTAQVYFLVYIGNADIGFDILNKIYSSQHHITGNVFIVFKNMKLYHSIFNTKLRTKLKVSYITVLRRTDYGNDILPTLMLYNMVKKYIHHKYIVKVHTKTNKQWRNNCLNFILDSSFNQLINLLKYNNCICHPKYYKELHHDRYNMKLVTKNANIINPYKGFCAGSIFFCSNNVFDQVLIHVIENFRCYFFFSNYDNNLINSDNSPPHFLERLFGVIDITNKKYSKFDHSYYIKHNQDLPQDIKNCKIKSWRHFNNHGKFENRKHKFIN